MKYWQLIGFGLSAADEKAAGKELKAEADRLDGPLKPEDVVRIAKKKKSVLHSLFEWDTDKAANEHWNNQARRLLRHVEIKKSPNAAPKKLHNVRITNEDNGERVTRGYVSSEEVDKSIDWIEQVHTAAVKRVLASCERALDVPGVAKRHPEWKAIHKAVKALAEDLVEETA